MSSVYSGLERGDVAARDGLPGARRQLAGPLAGRAWPSPTIIRPRYPARVSSEPLWQPSPAQVAASSLDRLHAPRRGRARRARAATTRRCTAGRWSSPRSSGALVWRFCGVVGDGPGPASRRTRGGCRARAGSPRRASTSPRTCCGGATRAPALLFRGEHGARRAAHAGRSCATQVVARRARRCASCGRRPGRPRRRRACRTCPRRWSRCWRRPASARSGRRARPTSASHGVLDRFGQIAPKVLFAADGYAYDGKRYDVRERVARDRCAALPSRRALRGRAVPRRRARRSPARDAGAGTTAPRRDTPARRSPSRASRSTTRSTSSTPRARPARPKCIVHGAGGTLLQHLKEHAPALRPAPGRPLLLLHDLRLDDVELARVGARQRGDARALRRLARSIPDARRSSTWRRAERVARLRHLGEVPRRASRKAGVAPARHARPRRACARSSRPARRSRPRASTSSTETVKRDVQPRLDLGRHRHRLAASCCGNPTAARSGAARSRRAGLGMAVDVFDDDGPAACAASKGELVCTRAVPVDAGRLLERPRRRALPRRLLRALPRRLAPRRLRRVGPRTAAS